MGGLWHCYTHITGNDPTNCVWSLMFDQNLACLPTRRLKWIEIVRGSDRIRWVCPVCHFNPFSQSVIPKFWIDPLLGHKFMFNHADLRKAMKFSRRYRCFYFDSTLTPDETARDRESGWQLAWNVAVGKWLLQGGFSHSKHIPSNQRPWCIII